MTTKRLLRNSLLAFGFLSLGLGSAVEAQISLTTLGTPVTQNFDTLAQTGTGIAWTDNSTLAGWYATRTAYNSGTGVSNAGAMYSFGIAGTNPVTDRALGGIGSGGTGTFQWAARYVNNTGATVNSFTVSYNGEQWRDGGNATPVAQPITFQYQVAAAGVITDADTPSSGWTNVTALDFSSPIFTTTAGALDGNAAANRTAKSATISLSAAPGDEIWIRWTDINDAGNDHGLSIDDLSVTPANVIPPPGLSINDVSLFEGNAGTTSFIFTVSLSAPAGAGGVTFDIATADGTATTADNDYAANSLTAQTIPAGSSTYSFTVLVTGDTATEANQTFFVNVTNVTGATVADGQGLGTILNDDVTLTPIHDIQGPGSSSPIVGSSVTTRGIVTGVRSNGFFIQEPDASVDADPATSEGILVFTSSAPPAAAVVGNLVQVTATVSEFVPSQDVLQPPLTELTSPTVNLVSSGNPLPAAIPLTASLPSAAGPYDQLERFESMRVSAASLTVVGPTLGSINEANATATSQGVLFATITGVPRAFREAGIQAPDPPPSGGGTIPPIPRFDTNPEVLRLDSDCLAGTTAIDAPTGAVITGAIGPLDYTFRHYSICPDTTLSFTGGVGPTAATTPASDELTVGAYNMQRFFDTVNDPSIGEPVLTATAFNNRLAKASLGIRNFLKYPDILGVVEVENLTTLQALAAQISSDAIAAGDPDPLYQSFLVEGNDVGGIDVGFLVKTRIVAGSTPRVSVTAVTQFNKNELFVNPDSSTALLNDRPPLVLEAVVNHPNGATFPVVVIINHLRSLGSVNDETAGSNGWPTEGARVRAKRQKQAESLANLIQARQIADPNERMVVLGDFNAFEVNDGYGHSMGTIQGTPVPDNETAVTGDGADLVNPDLTNLFDSPPPAERYSYVFDGNAQSLDHLLINSDLISATLARRIEHPRINADFPETAKNNTTNVLRLADHDPVVGFFQVAGFATADLSITKTDSPDPVTAGSNLVYTVTVTNAGPDAAVNASWSDTLPAGTTFVSLTAAGGWSCTTPSVGSGGTVSCSLASFAVGNGVFTLTVNVPLAAAGSTLSNTATVSSATNDPTPANNSATATTTVTGAADLSITKTDSPDPVTAGANLAYIVTVTNAGPNSASTVSWTDTLPAGTTFVALTAAGGWSCTTPAIGAGGTVTCSTATLATGPAGFSMVVNVNASVPTGTTLSNTATVTSATTDPTPGNNSATTTTTVNTSADVSVTKADGPDPVNAGSNITYVLTVANAGPSNAATLALADTLPAGTTFVSMAAPGGWSCTTPAVGAGGTVNCSSVLLPPGSNAILSLVVAVPIAATGTITNTATVSSATPDPSAANNSATASTGVNPSADLSISKTATGPATAGASFSYTVTVQNAGPGAATAATWSDTLPAGTTFVSLSSVAGWSCTTPAVGAGGTVNCSNASFAAGSAAFTLVVALDSATAGGSSLVNTATATATSVDPDSGDLTSTSTVAVIAPSNVAATKAVGGATTPGGTVLYHLELTNSGPADQPDLAGDELVDVLPPELILVSATASSGTATVNLGTNTVTWNGAIAVGDLIEIDIEATIDAAAPDGSTISNQATIHWDADGDGATSEATGTTDDPAQGGGADPTVFVVGGAEPVVDVPVLDHRGLLALAALIAAVALFRIRR